ncbi:MAG: glutamate-5-semialdehyde dehydrogenase [Clostridia bacterium]|nr:glutamate-5-semialdehyde dehydrogenase [Clostridia bacterium]
MIYEMLKKAKAASKKAVLLSNADKNKALNSMADALIRQTEGILLANEKDLLSATELSEVMKDRLRLTEERIASMADGLRKVATLPDPNGRVLETRRHQNGLQISKVSVPFGVIAVIFESRPNVAADTAGLALKSGNACVLRGGKESYNSCLAIVSALKSGLSACGLSEDLINLVEDKTREGANILMTATDYIDLLIPRGGAGLIRACVENATVPCIETGTGICHIYVDEYADINRALNIIENAKTSRPSVCNAEEVCLVSEKIAKKFLPALKERLVDKRIEAGKIPVELRLCEKSAEIIEGTPATDKDFSTEFLDYILAVKVVKNVDEAISHIDAHSTHHSEAIVTELQINADRFISSIDSAAVYVNASTRFTDGGEFGLGAEIGISTQKLHARGPMGINELNTYKYIIRGEGQTR